MCGRDWSSDVCSSDLDGAHDNETINVAFRAVHSIKGGAGAFGLDDLVDFSHQFETVMDACRSAELEITDDRSSCSCAAATCCLT